jgi:hypothetical protein
LSDRISRSSIRASKSAFPALWPPLVVEGSILAADGCRTAWRGRGACSGVLCARWWRRTRLLSRPRRCRRSLAGPGGQEHGIASMSRPVAARRSCSAIHCSASAAVIAPVSRAAAACTASSKRRRGAGEDHGVHLERDAGDAAVERQAAGCGRSGRCAGGSITDVARLACHPDIAGTRGVDRGCRMSHSRSNIATRVWGWEL